MALNIYIYIEASAYRLLQSAWDYIGCCCRITTKKIPRTAITQERPIYGGVSTDPFIRYLLFPIKAIYTLCVAYRIVVFLRSLWSRSSLLILCIYIQQRWARLSACFCCGCNLFFSFYPQRAVIWWPRAHCVSTRRVPLSKRERGSTIKELVCLDVSV